MNETWTTVRVKLVFYVILGVCTTIAATNTFDWKVVAAALSAGCVNALAFLNQSISRAKVQDFAAQQVVATSTTTTSTSQQ